MSSVGNVSGVCNNFVVISATKEETIYKKCFELVKYDMVGHRLAESFEEWGFQTPECLERLFSEKEIATIYSILQHYFILHYGPTDLPKCFKLLKVSTAIEILNPKNDLFSNFDNLFLSEQDCSQHYLRMLRVLEAYTKIRINPEKIAKLLERAAFTWDYSTLLANIYRPLELLSVEERCRLTFFISASLFDIDLYDSSKSILIQTNGWAREFSPVMARALQSIHICLSKIKDKSLPKDIIPEIPIQFRFAKPNITALPNCIPHAANSCYMASTLTPLAYVCDPHVQQALKRFEFMEATVVRSAFRAIYSNLKAEPITDISIGQVDTLRFAVLQAYDYRFFNPNESSQEDAGDFLMCILQELQMSTDCCFYEKHTFQPLESSVKIEPEHYNYDEVLVTKHRKLDQNMTDISLDDAGPDCTFADLTTGIRRTNDLDLNAYRKAGVETGPKYQTIMAHHQEQFMVEAADKAPDFFCARLRRFSQNPQTRARTKHRTPVKPSLTLQFQIKDLEDTEKRVTYELAAVTVHNGLKADGGHYYCYLRHEQHIYKYNDLTGAEAVTNEAQVWQDVLTDGYIFFYKKVCIDESVKLDNTKCVDTL